MGYLAPQAIHFYSAQTKISLELPLGWQEQEIGDHYAIYALEDERARQEGLAHPPKFVVKVVEVLVQAPDAYKTLACELISLPAQNLEIISHGDREVDGFDGVVDVFSYYEESVDSLVTQYQVFAQVGQVVFSLTGVVQETHKGSYLDVFEAAAESVRFIVDMPAREQ
jgi:hypothetical protein